MLVGPCIVVVVNNNNNNNKKKKIFNEVEPLIYKKSSAHWTEHGFQARSKDQEILEEGGGAGSSLLPRRDHE